MSALEETPRVAGSTHPLAEESPLSPSEAAAVTEIIEEEPTTPPLLPPNVEALAQAIAREAVAQALSNMRRQQRVSRTIRTLLLVSLLSAVGGTVCAVKPYYLGTTDPAALALYQMFYQLSVLVITATTGIWPEELRAALDRAGWWKGSVVLIAGLTITFAVSLTRGWLIDAAVIVGGTLVMTLMVCGVGYSQANGHYHAT